MSYTFKHGDRPLDGLTVQRAVGRGGFGEVYYALTDSGKQIALKYLRNNPDVELRGISHVMNLKSPHLVTIYDVRRNEADEPFVVMEYVSGPSLRDLLVAEPHGLGEQKAAFFLKGIAAGLSHLHERGIVHRDLKPGNIFYDNGYVTIGDYGLSKHISVSAHSGNTVSVGTVHYMAPEIGSGSYSKAIDIYALGVMLYEMLTGRLPFTGSSMGEILMRHLNDRPDLAGVREPYRSVIARALAKDPAERYQDVNEMVDALMADEQIGESLASFDASILSRVPRTTQHSESDLTRTSPPPRRTPPDLDVRDTHDLPPIPPIPDVLIGQQRQRNRGGRRQAFERQAARGARVRERIEQAGRPLRRMLSKEGRAGWDVTPAVKARWPQMLVILGSAIALGILLNLTLRGPHDEEGAVAIAMLLIGGTVGTLLGHVVLVQRMITPHGLLVRLAYAMAATLCVAPALAVAFDSRMGELGRAGIAMLTTLVLFDWRERINAGRRQEVETGNAFWHGIVGLIAGGILAGNAFVAGILSAALVFTVQGLAACWPVTGSVPGVATSPGRTRRRETEFHGLAAGIGIEDLERELHADAGRTDEPDHRARVAEGAAPPPPPPATEEQRSAPPPDVYQPSFVGRTANAGLSFLGKLMLLAGILAMFAYNYPKIEVVDGGDGVVYETGHVTVYDGSHAVVEQQVPRVLLLVPLLLGTSLLVAGRRHDGSLHFFRGLLAGALAIAAAIVALGPGAEGFRAFLNDGWEDLGDEAVAGPLILSAALLFISMALLFWPKRPRHRPIVI